jgi:hypothetical protein
MQTFLVVVWALSTIALIFSAGKKRIVNDKETKLFERANAKIAGLSATVAAQAAKMAADDLDTNAMRETIKALQAKGNLSPDADAALEDMVTRLESIGVMPPAPAPDATSSPAVGPSSPAAPADATSSPAVGPSSPAAPAAAT